MNLLSSVVVFTRDHNYYFIKNVKFIAHILTETYNIKYNYITNLHSLQSFQKDSMNSIYLKYVTHTKVNLCNCG